ncbi:hypothetical protein HK098_006523 [Nowakowskiella sp. JEL0407]|nr:hypothetical protein HK098_006523 [Nowakowskiella sp. JEL0407]
MEFMNQINEKETENKRLRDQIQNYPQQIESIRKMHQAELEQQEKEKETALNIVESKVRNTINAKDEIIQSLRTQIEELTIRSGHLEKLIDKQRQELLS